MKQITFYLPFIFILVIAGNRSFGQGRELAGKVVDGANKPLWGAVVRVSDKAHTLAEVRSDEEGMYKTQLLEQGSYSIVVQLREKETKTKKLSFDGNPEAKKYYVLKVTGDQLDVTKVDEAKFSEMNIRDRRDIQRRPKR